jgi:uncharacterized protein YjiS (DUF1127 family)
LLHCPFRDIREVSSHTAAIDAKARTSVTKETEMTVRHTTNAHTGFGAFAHNAVGLLVEAATSTWQAAENLYARIQYRRGVRQMLELDDHMLCDMGVTRGDVMRAANLPLSESAGEELKRISRTRLLR